jgi:hypothetical protein
LQCVVEAALKAAENLRAAIHDEERRRWGIRSSFNVLDGLIFFSINETPVTAAKILQPKDTHVFSVDEDYTVTGVGGFKSNSGHLYNGQQLLEGSVYLKLFYLNLTDSRIRSDQDIVEVFSRDLNPQHWHIARRGSTLDLDGRTAQSTVYYRSARKESSLADVDNGVATVVRKFTKPHVKSVSRASTIIAPRPEDNT